MTNNQSKYVGLPFWGGFNFKRNPKRNARHFSPPILARTYSGWTNTNVNTNQCCGFNHGFKFARYGFCPRYDAWTPTPTCLTRVMAMAHPCSNRGLSMSLLTVPLPSLHLGVSPNGGFKRKPEGHHLPGSPNFAKSFELRLSQTVPHSHRSPESPGPSP